MFLDAPYAKRGRPSKAMLAARAELDRRWRIHQDRLDAQGIKEMELAKELAELDGYPDALLEYWSAVYWSAAMVAERKRLYAIPL
jgi:hypothetical protein